MLFTLEVLQANHGDCLILYYGEADNPKVIVIDGGPKGIYRTVLNPRLLEVKTTLSPDTPLPLSMVMVSHLDDDHINGILAMSNEIVDKETDQEIQDFEVDNIWCNTFDDIIGNIQIPSIASLPASTVAASTASIPHISEAEPHIAAVIVSTGQGRKLRNDAQFLSATVNNPFTALQGKANLVRDGLGALDWDGLKITVLHPNEQRLIELQEKWDKDLQKALDHNDDSIIIASITDPDSSPFNLSSIVCLVEFNGKTMLLTGDARSDDIVSGLQQNNLLDANGHLHVDILKLPHHGSNRNMDAEFFQAVSADHYVISANGKHNNPDKGLLDIFRAEVSTGTLYITNHDGEHQLREKLDAFITVLGENESDVVVQFPKTDSSIVINLLEEIQF